MQQNNKKRKQESIDLKIDLETPIKNKIVRYFDKKFGPEPLTIFDRWNFEEIFQESKDWELRKRSLYVYIMANNCPSRRLHARTGCVADLYQRYLQYNAELAGGPQGTKKAAGTWVIMFWIAIPPIRNFSSKDIKNPLEKKRGWRSKCLAGIEIASQMGLDWKISCSIKNKDSEYYSKRILKYALQNSIRGNDIFF